MPTHDSSLFTVGEIINPEEWGIRLRIEELLPGNRIRAKIHQAQYMNPAVYITPFHLGQELFLRPGGPDNLWVIENSDHWFVLYVRGTKRFEHYR